MCLCLPPMSPMISFFIRGRNILFRISKGGICHPLHFLHDRRTNAPYAPTLYSLHASDDRAERYDFWPRLWLFVSVSKGEWISKMVIKGHAFLLDRLWRDLQMSDNHITKVFKRKISIYTISANIYVRT